jgi:ornithine decarboxylase
MDEPRFLLSRSATLKQYDTVKSECDSVSYSYKTNEEVGKLLARESDCMFSVHNPKSIDELGCPERIWFFAQAWNSADIKALLEKGITHFVVDNRNDLNCLVQAIKSESAKIQLLIRMRLKEHTIHTGRYYVFGMYSDEVRELIPGLRSNPLIDKLGIHFHRKTQNISEWGLKEELEDTLPADIISQLDYVNIGGGLPSIYKNFRREVLDSIWMRIEALRELLKGHKVRLIIEPGRFIAAPAVKFETTILNIYDKNIVVNASVYGGAMDTFVAHIRLLVEGEKESGTPYAIKGKTPCSVDIFRYKVFLDNPKVGDRLVFLNAGAYNFSTDFSGLEKPKTMIVK